MITTNNILSPALAWSNEKNQANKNLEKLLKLNIG